VAYDVFMLADKALLALRPFFVAGSLLPCQLPRLGGHRSLEERAKARGNDGPRRKKGTLELRQGDGTIVVISEADVEKV